MCLVQMAKERKENKQTKLKIRARSEARFNSSLFGLDDCRLQLPSRDGNHKRTTAVRRGRIQVERGRGKCGNKGKAYRFTSFRKLAVTLGCY